MSLRENIFRCTTCSKQSYRFNCDKPEYIALSKSIMNILL